MSRIHEALRKAEQEREKHASTEVPSIMAVTPVVAPSEIPLTVPVPDPGPLTSPLTMPQVSPIEVLRQKCAKPKWNPDRKTAVFASDNPSSVASEQFRTLRSRLYRILENYSCRTLLVTSALPAEGKTFVAANLAKAIVRQHERRALLIDADLRASRLHLEIGSPSAPGLSEYLRGEADEFSVIQSSEEGNLFFIPGGKPTDNPTELLGEPRLKNLLGRMASLFDWIVLDSPPVLPVADAGLLAGLCDGVLLVVRSGSTPFDAARKACSEFQGKNLIGAVLNRAEEIRPYSSYYYYPYGSNGEH